MAPIPLPQDFWGSLTFPPLGWSIPASGPFKTQASKSTFVTTAASQSTHVWGARHPAACLMYLIFKK